jgi:hypothetical protein
MRHDAMYLAGTERQGAVMLGLHMYTRTMGMLQSVQLTGLDYACTALHAQCRATARIRIAMLLPSLHVSLLLLLLLR